MLLDFIHDCFGNHILGFAVIKDGATVCHSNCDGACHIDRQGIEQT